MILKYQLSAMMNRKKNQNQMQNLNLNQLKNQKQRSRSLRERRTKQQIVGMTMMRRRMMTIKSRSRA
jgi:hypothetical protein